MMKIKVITFTICILVITVLQSTVLDYARVYNVKPNLLLVFIVSVALLKGNVRGAAIGFFCGLTQDMVSGKLLGFYALLGLYLGFAVGSLNKRLYRENLLLIIFFTFISTFIYEFIVYCLHYLYKAPAYMVFSIKNIILPEAIYNSIISILVYIFVIRLEYWFEGMDKPAKKY